MKPELTITSNTYDCYKVYQKPGVVAHAFNPSTREAEADGFLSLRPARAIQRNPVSKNQKKKKEKRKKKTLREEA